jgi:hypothetical protein
MTLPFTPDRRRFLAATGTAFAALVASGCSTRTRLAGAADLSDYGPLVPDPAGLLDLPEGFSYRVLSSLGETMADGFTVPDRADGMGCFDIGGGKLALVRNHELGESHDAGGDIPHGFGRNAQGKVIAGGTTTIVLDARSLAVEKQYRSLAGTIRNCAGGITPWGTWLTCEESMFTRDAALKDKHGWVFEVPANANRLVDAVPLKAMGRFNHEAACVDPRTGAVYQTEDQEDSLFYRYLPNVPGRLEQGGRLQALALNDGIGDSRNKGGVTMNPGTWHEARWIDLDDVEAPADDLRKRGAAQGALVIARGEGIWMGEGEMYFTATSGGTAGLGQIFRFRPGTGGRPDAFQLFFESTSPDQFNYGDNLCIAPNGHLVVCEDQYSDEVRNYLRGITPEGRAYPLGLIRTQTEPAGACFAPDGRTMFVNLYSPAKTLAISGPWRA